jgi:hypothetical protein
MEVITRKQALQQGLTRYYTGKPCKHGHIAERLVSSNSCLSCKQEYENRQIKSRKKYLQQYKRQWRQDNREYCLKSLKSHYQNNKQHYLYRCTKRRAQKLHATLPGHDDELRRIYKECPEGYHVDHIVPLKGESVCGLHVPWNLQYLTPEENLAKSNKLLETDVTLPIYSLPQHDERNLTCLDTPVS